MFSERTSVGLDVHARSVAAAAIDGDTGELFQTRLTPSFDHIVLDHRPAWPGGGGLRSRADRVRAVPETGRGRYPV